MSTVVGKLDKEKTLKAKQLEKTLGKTGANKQASLLMQTIPTEQSGDNDRTFSSSAYTSSYANGMTNQTTRDIPNHFALMNEQNGGLIYWPTTLEEKYEWYRYFATTDPYVSRAIELLTDLPMSKLTLQMPKIDGLEKELSDDIKEFYEDQIDHLNLMDLLHSILHEWNVIGNVYPFHEWDETKQRWDKIIILPPEEVKVFEIPFSTNKRIKYNPRVLIQIIQAGNANQLEDEVQIEMYNAVSEDIKKQVDNHGAIVMDTDPMTGSFTHHLSRKRSPYMDLGVSILERVLVPLLQKEHYKYTQLALASRNMTPKNLVTAPEISQDDLEILRSEIDMSYLDPEYSIVVNYEVNWELIGSDNRLLELSGEYEKIDSQVFAGLGVTRELLTGEGVYSGTKITVEILNTMFLKAREILKRYVEKELFKPIAEKKKWFKENPNNGVKQYFYPKLGFNRLTIRDNAEVFDSLFSLYQKGSLPIDVIYELFNLDTENLHEKIKEDLFTVKDPMFNRFVEDTMGNLGQMMVDRTDLPKTVAKYLGYDLQKPKADDGGGWP